jgi:thiazole synthase
MSIQDKPFTLAGVTFSSRLILGTGKYPSHEVMKRCHESSGTEMVTVAVRRLDLKATGETSLMSWIDRHRLRLLPRRRGDGEGGAHPGEGGLHRAAVHQR